MSVEFFMSGFIVGLGVGVVIAIKTGSTFARVAFSRWENEIAAKAVEKYVRGKK